MFQPISIRSIASVSALGSSGQDTWKHYLDDRHLLTVTAFGQEREWVAALPEAARKDVEATRYSDNHYEPLDASVIYAMYVSRKAVHGAGWDSVAGMGINIGSSRGATTLFENHHEAFLRSQRTSALTSPTTTLGNISSWVAHDLGSKGPEISHSITCSTALHAILNGMAWLRSGMASSFLAGGSEAPLTPFTIAQMKALKIYATRKRVHYGIEGVAGTAAESDFPCRALDFNKVQNSMVLGEGAAVACLERGKSASSLALIEGVGYATEPLQHHVSLSSDALCFQRSMKMALGDLPASSVDVLIMHSPGTIKGDSAELRAVQKCFGGNVPALTGNKWKIGHTFAASGMLSIEMAILMIRHQQFIRVPFLDYHKMPGGINRVMVNAVGFGGNAVSVLLKSPR